MDDRPRSSLERGVEACRRRNWSEAYDELSVADRGGALEPADLERFATVAYLVGRDEDGADAWGRAHRAYDARGDAVGAARCAFWLGFGAMRSGRSAQAGGWFARARRSLETVEDDCAERGYLLATHAMRSVGEGDLESAGAAFARALEIGRRFGDPDLTALARQGRGRVLVRSGEVRMGIAFLDEAMASVEAGDVAPVVAGEVYCSVLEACQEIADLRRAREWTAALSAWCDAQPGLVPYRGPCLLRRSEILQLNGAWTDALQEARRACDRLARPPGRPETGAAFYQLAELLRLRGEFAAAEEAYREATRWGRDPHPGLAQLRMAEARIDVAMVAVRRLLEEPRDPLRRAEVLPVCIEILLAAGERDAALGAAQELVAIADRFGTPVLRARADHGLGAARLAAGDPAVALGALRRAFTTWEGLVAPYEMARVRVDIARAYRALGDDDTAEMELDVAGAAFARLGAAADLSRLDRLAPAGASGDRRGLTKREAEVLRRVATGDTNRAIGRTLSISERTVERHLSNIFDKLGVASRAAATAFAYEHDLL